MLKTTKPLKGLDYLNTLPTGAIRAYETETETLIFEVARLGLVFLCSTGELFLYWTQIHGEPSIFGEFERPVDRICEANTWPVTTNEARQILNLKGVPEIER